MRNDSVEEQIQWMLLYVQKRSADTQKENILKNLEIGILEYRTIGKFLTDLKKKFGEGDDEIMKVAELKKIKQGSRMMEKFAQKFRRAAKESEYEGRLLVEEFKRGINEVIRRKLMKAERLLKSIKEQYERIVNLDKHWKKSRRKEERLKERREARALAQRTIALANTSGT